MPDQRLLECAVAFRMASITEDGGCPIVRSLDAAEAETVPEGATVLRLEAGCSAEAVRDAVAVHISSGNQCPDAIVIEGEVVLQRSQAADPGQRLAGRIALVTGSAQGFGKGIAEALAGQGAVVAIADLNAELGVRTAQELNDRYGDGTAVFAEMNVTDRTSSNAAIAACIDAFGGIDLFVANAGVLKAGGVDELDEGAFDLVTAVNYKGYAIGVMAVSPWMKLQHSHNADHYMDIIQINSKSGLEGSKRNFVYAGSKFGTIGLTQSFAMELVEQNIKVNSICPGNFFDGPLWSDPENGLFVQYLQTGKVPGATSVDDVKAFYMAKVPMKRGCTPEDVATAIFYAVEQKYETGQAIPVTGGQVMLN